MEVCDRDVSKFIAESRIMERLAGYDPLLAGTIPIGIDIEGSDLDILCYYEDKASFVRDVTAQFGMEEGFYLSESQRSSGVSHDKYEEHILCRFNLGKYPVEIYGCRTPVLKQRAYLHMVIEDYLLRERGEEFRKEIIRLKQSGYKTEPAFCHLLGIDGDPYEGLLSVGKELEIRS